MPKLARLVRENDRIIAATIDDAGKVVCQYFPKTMSFDDVKAEVLGTSAPEKKAVTTAEENVKDKTVTVPAPPVVTRPRVSREQMIAALEKAEIKVDVFDPVKLRAAYKALIAKGGDK